jgi:hypothetical protein
MQGAQKLNQTATVGGAPLRFHPQARFWRLHRPFETRVDTLLMTTRRDHLKWVARRRVMVFLALT